MALTPDPFRPLIPKPESRYRYPDRPKDAPLEPSPLPLKRLIGDFLADQKNAGRSPHTLRAYASDLAPLAASHPGPAQDLTVDRLRAFFSGHAKLAPATRARKQAAVAAFLAWACRHDLIPADPMTRIDRIRREPPPPRGVGREAVEKILAAIPPTKKRDRLLFRLVFETGLRIGEALGIHLEDLDLSLDNERLSVLGKGGKRRTILLDDPRQVRQLRSYLKDTGYKYGPLFRAEKNSRGGPLRYQSIQERWANYCRKAGVACTIHQLRHTHATELVNGGVSLATLRKRLGHANLQTTLRYAEQSDATADAEMRAWRRRRNG